MSDVNTKAAAYSVAAKEYMAAKDELHKANTALIIADDRLRKAEMERNRAQRELLEQAVAN